MEVAGLAFGVVSLVIAFKDIIKLFGLFSASREFGRDLVILLTKLDIEKFLLLQWAEQVGFLKHVEDEFYDDRLNEINVRDSVAQILTCIHMLLSDSSQLKKRYGLKESPPELAISSPESYPTISQLSMSRFEQRFKQLNLKAMKHQQSTSLFDKFRWVIHDKQKFGDLITELSHFTSKLREIVPPAVTDRTRTAQLSSTKDLEAIRDLGNLKIILEASTGHRGAIAEVTQEIIDNRCEKRILNALWFRKLDDRRQSIASAHQKTFDWALKPSDSEDPLNDLATWLRVGSGIYWISGKAGSGKSTLMKFLYLSHRTRDFLRTWAGGQDCNIADFFFWYLGTSEQNTQEGLSRALLFRMLSCCPALICRALPNMWKEVNDVQESVGPPTLAEVKYAFEVISSYNSIPPFCLFIDGLDEYVGDFKSGIALINRLAMNNNIKVIVSSRPIPQCVSQFKHHSQLRLQDLTKGDISTYVSDVIGENGYMKKLLARDPERSRNIMTDLVDKSSGVFLWVVLACSSLINGFEDYDRITELQRRVDELPPELEDMFQHMLRRVDERHRQQGSRLLWICHANQKAREQGKTELDLYVLELSFIEDFFDHRPNPTRFIPDEDRAELIEGFDGRLRSRCGGLLELVPRGPQSDDSSFCFCSAADWPSIATGSTIPGIDQGHDRWVDAKVSFMHRTVFEFLNSDETWQLPCLKLPEDMAVTASAMSLGLLQLSILSRRIRCSGEESQALACLRDGIAWGVQADRNMSSEDNIFWRLSPILDALSMSTTSCFDSWNDHYRELSHAHSCYRQDGFSLATLIIAIEAGAMSFSEKHPSLKSMLLDPEPLLGCQPLLFHAVHSRTLLGIRPADEAVADRWMSMHMTNNMVSMLLSAGCDPNEDIEVMSEDQIPGSQNTPWKLWLDSQAFWLKNGHSTNEDRDIIAKTLETFRKSGADLSSVANELTEISNMVPSSGNLGQLLEHILLDAHAGHKVNGESSVQTRDPSQLGIELAQNGSYHKRKREESVEMELGPDKCYKSSHIS